VLRGFVKEKSWAEARREEEEDLNLSPWFIIKPFPVLIFLLAHPAGLFQSPDKLNISVCKINATKKMPRQ